MHHYSLNENGLKDTVKYSVCLVKHLRFCPICNRIYKCTTSWNRPREFLQHPQHLINFLASDSGLVVVAVGIVQGLEGDWVGGGEYQHQGLST